MKKVMRAVAAIMLLMVVVYATGCKKEQLAEVQTSQVTNVKSSTATAGGMVVSDGNSTITERGVCWGKQSNPTIDNYHKSAGSGIGSFTCDITGLDVSTTYYLRAYALNGAGISYGSEVNFRTTGGGGTYNGHDYVDLGLPSGTLWATCNVGATTPEGYGSYFAWGETRPKDFYWWNTYKWCIMVDNHPKLVKYCYYSTDGYNGMVDNQTVLQAADDAATANWGEGWCMPTPSQLHELETETNSIWTTQDGVSGKVFIAKDGGSSIFLPAAGWFIEDRLLDEGEGGSYFSNTLVLEGAQSFSAGRLGIIPNGTESDSYNRSCGFSVRPVRSTK